MEVVKKKKKVMRVSNVYVYENVTFELDENTHNNLQFLLKDEKYDLSKIIAAGINNIEIHTGKIPNK